MTSAPLNVNLQSMTSAISSLSRMVNDSMQIGIDLLESFSTLMQSSMQTVPGQLTQHTQRMMDSMQNVGLGCSCRIPPPCWLPQPAGHVLSHVCPGATAVLRLCVTNCGFTTRTINIEPPASSGVTVTPASLSLGPLERGCVSLSLAVPPDAKGDSCHDEKEVVIFVRGCKTHYVRWTVSISRRGACTCHEICLDDCEDLVHHWYDHFYCRRPCPNQSTNPPGTGTNPLIPAK